MSLLTDLIGHGRQRRHRLVEVDYGSIVDLDRRAELTQIIPNDEYRPCGQVAPWDEAEEVNQRDASAHEFTEADVIGMVRISTLKCVAEPALVLQEFLCAEPFFKVNTVNTNRLPN